MNQQMSDSYKREVEEFKNGLPKDQRESMILNLVFIHDLDMNDPMNLQFLRY